uniref:Uncharacterized protein n=1 Tax=Rhizophora mucronata TaxID=61149 RepID=A0A2P2JJD6_RHIMU
MHFNPLQANKMLPIIMASTRIPSICTCLDSSKASTRKSF